MWRGLSRGQGATVTDWFLEPTCPHSVRAFGKLGALLEAAGEDRLTVRITLHAQPWHLFSGVVSRAVLAATLLPDAGDAAWRVLAAVGAARDEFIATDHSHGPNMDLPLTAMLDRIADRSGVDVRPTFASKDVTTLFKAHTRFARQNGILASPTVMVDGLIDDRIGSRDDVSTWLTHLGTA